MLGEVFEGFGVAETFDAVDGVFAGLFGGVEQGLDSWDRVGVGVGRVGVWDDEWVACGVVAVVVGVDKGECGGTIL